MVRFVKKVTRLSFLAGLGAAVFYFLDPRSGRGRRARAKDQLVAKARRKGQEVQQKASYVGGKLEGVAQSVRQPGGEAPADDKALADKVKSEVLGGQRFEGHQVVVDAADGVVALRGEVQTSEQIDELEGAVRKVAGVRDVENYVHVPGEPAPNKQDSLGA
ncbi:MAG: BON domain-containing protein [Actinomycetota bacterium]|nr:BON domain-containing protein [Actinomycetota bacterium]